MEQLGAEVVAYDLSEDETWDLVPFDAARAADATKVAEWKAHIRKLNNGWWLCHKALRSSARVVYGSVYSVPEGIGPVDIATFGCILLHLRDPFLALATASRLTRETVIVTDMGRPHDSNLSSSASMFDRLLEKAWSYLAPRRVRSVPTMTLLPSFERGGPVDAWWKLSPEIVRQFLGILGFEQTTLTYHTQNSRWGKQYLYTVVGQRTRPFVADRCAA
jgi:hypothetical protein